MLDHYLAVGGNEVVNSARAYGYATTGDCPIEWLEDPECSTIQDAVQRGAYDRADIAEAPWYDPDDPDVTGRFLGLYGIDILGLSDSTREAAVVQRNGDGAVVTGYRHGPREVRVRGWMTGVGMDAVEAGMTWLRNVLEPNACGVHGGSCGTADAAFFVDCPPPRREITAYTAWEVARTNYAQNPDQAVGGGIAEQLAGGTWTPSQQTISWHPFLTAAYRRTNAATQSSTGRGAAYGGNPTSPSPSTSGTWIAYPVVAGGTVSASAWMNVVVAGASGRHQLFARFHNGAGAWVGTEVAAATLANNQQRATGTWEVPAGATYVVFGHRPEKTTDYAAGDYFETTGIQIERGPVTAFFSGASTPAPEVADVERYHWAGTANNSNSLYETRTAYLAPEGDDTYQSYVDSWRRFLHQVRCVSGPFIVQERESSDGTHFGRLVEFTLLSGVPWVYGVPKEIDVPPIVPTVVQDIVYNLAPYPSAELPGAAMITATNYSTNPSVETNATGWQSASDGTIITGTTGARSTELASVGAASFKVLWTAPGATGSGGWLGGQQTVDISAAPAGSRFSINMWAAGSIQSGTAALGALEIRAYWQNASSVTLREDLIGTVPGGSGAVSLSSIAPPAGATKVVVRALQRVTSAASGAVLRVYIDALAVTVP